MNRPYVICHMLSSIDGKVTGEFLFLQNRTKASEIYYEINRNYKADAFACGRVTMEESFTKKWYPNLDNYQECDSFNDFYDVEKEKLYAVAFDPHARLGWISDKIIDVDEDPGYHNAKIIEVLSKDIDKRYLSYLRCMNIPYIICGDQSINVLEALEKLKKYFNINKLLLEGGSIINGGFMQEDLIDEISLVIDSVTADSSSKSLFDKSIISVYEIKEVKQYSKNVIWIKYAK